MKRLASVACSVAALLALMGGNADATERDRSERAAFQRENPCPATHKPRGACPGWEVDHIVPLKCGGPDKPHNMQWLTVEQHKIKTRKEAAWCRNRNGSPAAAAGHGRANPERGSPPRSLVT